MAASVEELVNALTKCCEKKITASPQPGMGSRSSESNLQFFLEAARNESEFLSGINASSGSFDKRMQLSETMIHPQCEAVMEHMRAINTREIDASLRSLDILHQLSESKLMKIIDFYDKDIDQSISKLSYKVKQSHDELRKTTDTSLFLEKSIDLYYQKLKQNYGKALKRTQQRFEDACRSQSDYDKKWNSKFLAEIDSKLLIYRRHCRELLNCNDGWKRVTARLHAITDKLCARSVQYIDEKESLKEKEFALRQEKRSLVDLVCMDTRKYDDIADKLESEYMESLVALSNKVIATTKLAEKLNCQFRLLKHQEDDLQELTRSQVHKLKTDTSTSSSDDPRLNLLRMGTRIKELCAQMNLSDRECENIMMSILDGSSGDTFGFDY